MNNEEPKGVISVRLLFWLCLAVVVYLIIVVVVQS
jgi:hypothetical protein